MAELIQGNYYSEESQNALAQFKVTADKIKATKDSYKYLDTNVIVDSVSTFLTNSGYDHKIDLTLGAAPTSTKHIAEFTMTSMKLLESDGGGFGKILITNAFNGESSLTISGGAIRFCCANGLVIGKSEVFEKIRHRIGVTLDEKLRMLNDKIMVVCEYLENNFGPKVEEMISSKLNYTEEMGILLNLEIPKKVFLDVVENIHPDNRVNMREEDQESNVWTLYNVVNESIREHTKHGMADFEANENLMENMISLAA